MFRPSLAQPPAFSSSHPDMKPVHRRAVECALRWAWLQVVATKPTLVSSASEEEITYEIEKVLNRRANGVRAAPGLRDFETVVRGAKQETADGRIEKEPDLTFRPPVSGYRAVTSTSDWGLFVEAKLLEIGHSTRTVGGYVDNGVQRFVDGEYARRMSSGLMVAYVRDERLPLEALSALNPQSAKGDDDRICSSVHQRNMLTVPCVEITLRHLWLDARAVLQQKRHAVSP